MNGMLSQLMNNLLAGKYKNEMASFNQMMSGKTPDQQVQTLLNMAQSRGFDINAKIFSDDDLKTFGITSLPKRAG